MVGYLNSYNFGYSFLSISFRDDHLHHDGLKLPLVEQDEDEQSLAFLSQIQKFNPNILRIFYIIFTNFPVLKYFYLRHDGDLFFFVYSYI